MKLLKPHPIKFFFFHKSGSSLESSEVDTSKSKGQKDPVPNSNLSDATPPSMRILSHSNCVALSKECACASLASGDMDDDGDDDDAATALEEAGSRSGGAGRDDVAGAGD